jgi:hypothetical protein
LIESTQSKLVSSIEHRLLEKVKIARKVQNRVVAPIHQTIAQVKTSEVNDFTGRINEKTRLIEPTLRGPRLAPLLEGTLRARTKGAGQSGFW